jgi:hypothetical protein
MITGTNRALLNCKRGLDLDIIAFITATGITDATQITAIDYLVVNLKLYNLWTKFKAIYPFVGGTAFTHKFNLKDPRDLDAAFRLSFGGGLTHSSTGCLPNGTSGNANTFFIPSDHLTISSAHISFYSRTNTNQTEGRDMFVRTSLTNSYGLSARRNSNLEIDLYYNNNTSRVVINNSTSTGFYLGNRNSSSIVKAYKNGSFLASNTATIAEVNVLHNLYLFAFNDAGSLSPNSYGNRECAFASMGDGMSDNDTSVFYNIVQQYQTILGRAVI